MPIALFVLALAAAALILPQAADAASVKDIFKRHGLFGTWAVDCSRPPSAGNPHVVYRPGGGHRVERLTSIEPGRTFDVSVVDSAAEASPSELIVSWQTGEGGIANRILLQGGRMQVLESTRSNGEKLVVDGRRVRDNAEAPRFEKCRPGGSAGLLVAPPSVRG
jgi:hypothetical protein